MADAKLLRAVLTHIESYPALFDLATYGEVRPSGEIIADVAGRVLLESGWTLVADQTFRSPDGTREISRYGDIEDEAQALLGLSDDQLWDGDDLDSLFDLGADAAVNRLRKLAEQAKAVSARG